MKTEPYKFGMARYLADVLELLEEVVMAHPDKKGKDFYSLILEIRIAGELREYQVQINLNNQLAIDNDALIILFDPEEPLMGLRLLNRTIELFKTRDITLTYEEGVVKFLSFYKSFKDQPEMVMDADFINTFFVGHMFYIGDLLGVLKPTHPTNGSHRFIY
jgi:hypothetical protein